MRNKTIKKSLRTTYRQARRQLQGDARAKAESAINNHISSVVDRDMTVCAYLAADGEVDLKRWLKSHAGLIGLPCVTNDTMVFRSWQPGEALTTNRFGLKQPSPTAQFMPGDCIDIILTPLVAFDESGIRLGMGGGYYDRYLAQNSPAASELIGIAFECQRSAEPLPREVWDHPLTAVITESGIQEFK